MSSCYRKPDCIINPYEFGKKQNVRIHALWLKELELLKPTKIIPKEQRTNNLWKAVLTENSIAGMTQKRQDYAVKHFPV